MKQKTDGQRVRILGIETSCDETAAAVVENGTTILSNVIASQVDLHARYGGVFPEVASRQHILSIFPVVEEALTLAHLGFDDIDAVAVTRGPGLAGSLVVGVNMAKGIALARDLPLIGVNHLEAHIYSAWLQGNQQSTWVPPSFPVMALLVSGGHTELNLMTAHLAYHRLGGTVDDAAGEAFDKVARLLHLSYPGGPSVQKAAEDGISESIAMPRAKMEGTWNFSFSGIKTAVLRFIKRIEEEGQPVPVSNLAAAFQKAVIDVLYEKTMAAAREYHVQEVVIAGGVSANKALRAMFLSQEEFPLRIPPLALCTDNAAMTAAAGYYRFMTGDSDSLDTDVMPNWPLSVEKLAG